MPSTPVTVVRGDATITADNSAFKQSGLGPQTLIVLGDGNALTASTGSGADTLEVYGDLNVLRGGNGADMLNAYGEMNTLIGGAGAGQQLYAAGNSSLLVGGTGRNQDLTVDGNDSVLIAQGSGSTLLANGNNSLLVAGMSGAHSLTVYGNDSELIGGSGANTLTAFGNNNVLVVAGCDAYKILGSNGCGSITVRTLDQYRQKADWVLDRQIDGIPEIEMPQEPNGCGTGSYGSGHGCSSGYSVSYLEQWSECFQSYDFDRCNRNAPQQSLYLEGNDGILIGGGDGANTITALGNDNLLVAGDRGTQTLTLDGNDGTMIGGGQHGILTANGNGNLLVAGAWGVQFLTVNGNDCTLIGGGGINLMTANGDNNVLEAGWGANTLMAAGFNETYKVDLGDGRTSIVNGLEGNGAANALEFTTGIDSDELWFRRAGDDLRIDVMGTRQSVTVEDWFAAAHHELAEIRTADGGVLDTGEVGQLVQAMANVGHSGYWDHVPDSSALHDVVADLWFA